MHLECSDLWDFHCRQSIKESDTQDLSIETCRMYMELKQFKFTIILPRLSVVHKILLAKQSANKGFEYPRHIPHVNTG